ncbi:MAG: class I SAM-dependent methyltransferase [Polyangiaceae bacterium]|jgi:SAM-dependent methyltransferase
MALSGPIESDNPLPRAGTVAMVASTDLVVRQVPDEALVDVECPLCEVRDSRFLMHGCDRLFGRPGWYRLVECASCGMKYVNPRPTEEALVRHYPDDYLPVKLPDATPTMAQRLAAKLIDLRWLGYMREIERAIGRISPDANVVDVGSGLNEWLVRLERLRGCRGLAIDVNPGVAEYIRGRLRMPVSEGTLLQARVESGTVDLVTMNEYLEHEPEPRSVLLEARRISRAGAHLVVEVPYMGGLPSRVFGSCWSQLDVPRHLAFYTPETLAKMLERCGYRLIHMKPFGAPFSLGISVLQSLGFKRLGRLRAIDALLIALAGAPFLPFFPWLREFVLVVARAE